MIELHSWPTPNGLKISIFLEETGLDHKIMDTLCPRALVC